ncbi:hypothetical protein [Lysobacter gummosus]|uniref:hypothetical protein n=1 Tax=Lysobacter gummosus TaxID=262324 RepID=UPI00363968EB
MQLRVGQYRHGSGSWDRKSAQAIPARHCIQRGPTVPVNPARPRSIGGDGRNYNALHTSRTASFFRHAPTTPGTRDAWP